ncbi:MAG: PAS domain S-box protein [Pseudomonadota bacterium]|nr:PAS domain S-box protein [Pseudomonadota bacterium]
MPAVLWERDGQTGNFTYVSEQGTRMLGLPAHQWIDQPNFWREHVHPDDLEEAERTFHADVRRGTGYSIEYRMLAGDGRVVWVRDVMNVVFAHGRRARTYGVLVDVTVRKLAEETEAHQGARLRRQNAALLDIAGKETLHIGDLDPALRLITEAAAHAMDVSRASFWAYDGARLSCLDLYEREHRRHSSGAVLTATTYPGYFAALEGGRAVPAEDALRDPRTRELVECVQTHGIRSMLDAPIRVGGHVRGVLCLEHVGQFRVWMPDEQQFVGTLADLIALAMEASDRRAAQAAQRASEARTRAVLGASKDAIVVADMAGRVVEFSAAAEVLFGRARADTIGIELVGRLVPARQRDLLVDAVARVRACDELAVAAHDELVGLRADGSEFPIEVTLFPVPDETGTLTGAFVRERTKEGSAGPRRDEHAHAIAPVDPDLEALIEARTREVRAAMLEMETFSYTVSHDLRAPIRAIEAFAQLLADECGDQLGERGERYLQRIRDAARRLSILVTDFMLLARVASTEMSRVPVDLTALARAVAEDLRLAAPERVATFLIDEHMEAQGDPGLLRILLENLVGNAWKFTARHPAATIRFGATEVGQEVVYTLSDDGAGFDPAYADQLFRPFSRLHAPGEFEGTGIGLAIARRIVERHGGRIWAEGAVETGASFHFTLGG